MKKGREEIQNKKEINSKHQSLYNTNLNGPNVCIIKDKKHRTGISKKPNYQQYYKRYMKTQILKNRKEDGKKEVTKAISNRKHMYYQHKNF